MVKGGSLVVVALAAGLGSDLLFARYNEQKADLTPATYQRLAAFTLAPAAITVANFTLDRDRVKMTFTGTFYLEEPTEAHVTGAVFVGQGTVHVDAPPSDFEKDNLKRLLGADNVESDFKTAVFRMTDDAASLIQAAARPSDAPGQAGTLAGTSPAAQRLAAEFEPRLRMETGINLSARLLTSIANHEDPGVFVAEFDGGRRGRFDVVLDQQNRIPMANFGVDGGEKGLVFSYQPAIYNADIWTAFYAAQDYERKTVVYADANTLVDITHYAVDIDVRNPSSHLGEIARMDMKVLAPNVRAIPFRIGEELDTRQDGRLKRQMRLKSARVGGKEATAIQEDWEGGFTVLLPADAHAGDTLSVEVTLDGNFMETGIIPECAYLISNDTWLPRHGQLDRATFDLTFHHAKRHVVASIGTRVSELPDAAQKDTVVTTYHQEQPVALAVFAVGPFERARRTSSAALGGQSIALEFNAVSQHIAVISNDFILAEMDNAVRFFAEKFGKYPYDTFGAVIHPYGFGQGFPTLLMLPPADNSNDPHTFVFLSHETAHQWWGNVVAWRSYRDQWLSEGFAEYSGMLYAVTRNQRADVGPGLFREAREALHASPRTTVGVAKGRLEDIGPIILGRRLNTSRSFGAYQALIYKKGALVLRMLHFLLSNPANGDDKPFYAMLSDFVERYRNGYASTDDFFKVAGEHFARSPIGQKYSLRDLSWFQNQWVLQSDLPSYTLEYALKDQPDSSVMLSGTVRQEGVPDSWQMPLPIVLSFANNQIARTTIRASGPSATFELKLPAKPLKIELDPASWVLSDKVTVRGK